MTIAGRGQSGLLDGAEAEDEFAEERLALGARLRYLRRGRGLTTRELSKQSMVSASLISQIENGKENASLASLRRIAIALGLPVAELFLDPSSPQSRRAAGTVRRGASGVVKKAERKKLHIPKSNYVIELLTPDLQGAIEFAWFEMEPGPSEADLMSHAGEECALVISGTMHLHLGHEILALEEGDSIRFDSSVPHKVENRGPGTLVQISAMTPPSF